MFYYILLLTYTSLNKRTNVTSAIVLLLVHFAKCSSDVRVQLDYHVECACKTLVCSQFTVKCVVYIVEATEQTLIIVNRRCFLLFIVNTFPRKPLDNPFTKI